MNICDSGILLNELEDIIKQSYIGIVNSTWDIIKQSGLSGDFNAEETETCLSEFLFQHDLTNIIKENTCYKNPVNPTSIDLFLTNFPRSFQHTIAVTTGLSDFHKMIVTVLKNTFYKTKPKILHYRCYRAYNCNEFRDELNEALSSVTKFKGNG